ncbi:MAG: YvrJ family protein, partial [Syntrophomonadaceae bacterium]|nr:YvrJ family protein [Syntrophomonadaceae bacterium]NLX02333.1 YvrJ family protein [Syntrophomonadaceae bacterium]
MEELLNIIGNVGFPIAVSAYLLIRVEAKLGELSNTITQLREAIITLP